MWKFWLVAALFIAGALAFVLIPLLRKHVSAGADRRAMNVEIYKDQFVELENDLKNGTISQDQYAQARVDLERSLLSDVSDENAAAEKAEAGLTRLYTRVAAGAVIVAVLFVPPLMYGKLGAGEPGIRTEVAEQMAGASNSQHKQIAQMVEGLAERLKTEPDNRDGWYMLGKSYQFLQRYTDAVAAYEHLLKHGGDQNPDVYANLADAVAMAEGRVLGSRSKALLDQALKIDPKHTKSLWLVGTIAFQEKEYKKALDYWLRLEPLFADKPGERDQIRGNILETKAALGMDTRADERRWAMEQGGGEDEPAAPTAQGGGGGAMVQGRVQLDASIAKRAKASDTVFIFARAADGPPMPLAVLRKQVKDLPMDFKLDDSMAMSPAMKLSSFPRVVVTARVSKSGNAVAQPGDLQAQGSTVDIGSGKPVQLVINSIVP